MTPQAITAAVLFGVWGFIFGFGFCLWLVHRAERIGGIQSAWIKNDPRRW